MFQVVDEVGSDTLIVRAALLDIVSDAPRAGKSAQKSGRIDDTL